MISNISSSKLEKILKETRKENKIKNKLNSFGNSIIENLGETFGIESGRVWHLNGNEYSLSSQFGKKTIQENFSFGEKSIDYLDKLRTKGIYIGNEKNKELEERGISSFLALNLNKGTYFISFDLDSLKEKPSLFYTFSVLREGLKYQLFHEDKQEQFEKSAEIQKSFIGEENPTLEGFDISYMLKQKEGIGGDLINFSKSGHCLNICHADAMGHGVSAAMLAMILGTNLFNLSHYYGKREENSIWHSFSRTHNAIKEWVSKNSPLAFISASDIRISPKGNITYLNCGHLPPMIINKENYRVLEKGGIILGAPVEFPKPEELIGLEKIKQGEILVSYSDGISETTNKKGEQFGEERLIEIIKKNSSKSSENILKKIKNKLNDFTRMEKADRHKENLDDSSIILLKRDY